MLASYDVSARKRVLVSEGSSLSAREAITALAWRAIGSVSETPIPFVWGVSHDLLPIIIGVHPSESPVGVPEFRVRPCCQAEFWLKLLSQLRTLAHAHSQLLGPVNNASGQPHALE